VTGRLVPPELPDAFVDAIVTLLADRPGLGRLGASARDEAKRRFSWDVVGDRYALALARLAERPLPTAAAC
jgi:glycosyltransferase involved in cell wall biosynthesis